MKAHLKESEYQRRKTTTHIVIHCSATKPSQDIGAKEIREWHVNERKWADIGYHYVIRRNGVRELGRPTWAVGAHVEGHNSTSVALCLVGGVDEAGQPVNNYTPEQMATLELAVRHLKRDHYPHAEVVGHTDFEGVTKACPCFDVKAWFAPMVKKLQKEINERRCIE